MPNISGGGAIPIFDVYQCKESKQTKLYSHTGSKFHDSELEEGIIFELTDEEKESFILQGDIKIVFKNNDMYHTTICRIMFNTAFIQRGNYIKAGKLELSPQSICKDEGKTIPNDFMIFIFFEDYCAKCDPETTKVLDLCENCMDQLEMDVLKDWIAMNQQMVTYEDPNYSIDPIKSVVEKAMGVQLKFNPDYYRILTKAEAAEQSEGHVYQKAISFPAAPHEINADLLALMESNADIENETENDEDEWFIINPVNSMTVPKCHEKSSEMSDDEEQCNVGEDDTILSVQVNDQTLLTNLLDF